MKEEVNHDVGEGQDEQADGDDADRRAPAEACDGVLIGIVRLLVMNLALVAGQLQTKYLNHIFTVNRGHYGELGDLLITATVIGFVVPVAVILLLRKRV